MKIQKLMQARVMFLIIKKSFLKSLLSMITKMLTPIKIVNIANKMI